MKKFTLDTFVKLKAAKDKMLAEPIKVNVDGEEIEVKKLSGKTVVELLEVVGRDAPIIELCDQLIYEAIPELHQKDVLEEFGCTENPPAVVSEVFSYGARIILGSALRDVVEETNIDVVKN
jgi:hypothetical protein